MRKSKYSEEQIIGFLKQAEAGVPVAEICRKGGFSDATFYKWRSKFGGMEASDAKRLRELEEENAKIAGLRAESVVHDLRTVPDRPPAPKVLLDAVTSCLSPEDLQNLGS